MIAFSSLQRDKKLDSLTDKDITYSYNLYVVLDQLARLNSEADFPFGSGEKIRLTPQELEILKKMVDDNDEDLLIYFEEYVEKSGPVYQASGLAWKSFCRFGKMAKEIYARSKRFANAKAPRKKNDEDEEGGEGADDEEENELEEEQDDDDDEGAGKNTKKAHAQIYLLCDLCRAVRRTTLCVCNRQYPDLNPPHPLRSRGR